MIRTDWPDSSPRPVAVVRLDRPEKKNALTPGMLDDLCSALTSAGQRAAAIVLAGCGEAFCSGFDLSLCKEDSSALASLLAGLSRAIRLLRDLPVPIVAAAHGAAIAGGCALLAGSDIVVTHPTCRLGYPVVRLGISPAVNAPFLLDAIGPGPSREWLLSGQILTGLDAHRRGLAHDLAQTAEQVIDAAQSIADQLAAKPTVGLVATKRWLNELSPAEAAASRALGVSMSLVGSTEQRRRLASLWT